MWDQGYEKGSHKRFYGFVVGMVFFSKSPSIFLKMVCYNEIFPGNENINQPGSKSQ